MDKFIGREKPRHRMLGHLERLRVPLTIIDAIASLAERDDVRPSEARRTLLRTGAKCLDVWPKPGIYSERDGGDASE